MPDTYEGLSARVMGELLRREDDGAIAFVKAACAPGLRISDWAKTLGVSRRTLERWLALDVLQSVTHPPRGHNARYSQA